VNKESVDMNAHIKPESLKMDLETTAEPEAENLPLVASSAAQLPAAPEPAPMSMMNFIAEALSNPAISESKLEVLLRLQREVRDDEAREEFTEALRQAQAEMPRVKKNGTIDLGVDKSNGRPRGSIPFAKYEDVDAVVRPIAEKYGFSWTFSATERGRDGGGALCTMTLSRGRHSREISIPLPLDAGPGRNNLQAMGSTMSYCYRYLTEMAFRIVREGADDDGVRGGTVYLSEAEIEEIRSLLLETKTDVSRWLNLVPGTKSIEEIERGAFVACRNSLLQKRAAAAKKAQQ
jgi:ERF superfamily protein